MLRNRILWIIIKSNFNKKISKLDNNKKEITKNSNNNINNHNLCKNQMFLMTNKLFQQVNIIIVYSTYIAYQLQILS